MKFAGIDVGSISTKAALLVDGVLQETLVLPTGYNAGKAGQAVFDALLSRNGLTAADIANVVATGYGRNSVAAARRVVTEITCHAAGARFQDPTVRSVIDIGGQDSKVIVLGPEGRVKDFAMNDKCAAGTGRFLEVMARALEVDLDGFGALSLTAVKPAPISSMCTVFAESEVISLIAKGEARANIVAGIHEAVAARVVAMGARIGLTPPVVMTGGVALNAGVVKALENKTGLAIRVSTQAQANGAIGAACIAAAEMPG